jgi:hypothetical protein
VWVEEVDWDKDTPWTVQYLKDFSGNGRHLEIVSGSSYTDWVLKAPAGDAEWIAADDGTFYTSEEPNEIDAAARAGMAGDQFFYGNNSLGVYPEDQTGAVLVKADKHFGIS